MSQSLTERELLIAHAEIEALKEKYGLSYKDAAHSLYHSELNKLNADDNAYHIMADAVEQLDGVVENAEKSIIDIDEVTKTA